MVVAIATADCSHATSSTEPPIITKLLDKMTKSAPQKIAQDTPTKLSQDSPAAINNCDNSIKKPCSKNYVQSCTNSVHNFCSTDNYVHKSEIKKRPINSIRPVLLPCSKKPKLPPVKYPSKSSMEHLHSAGVSCNISTIPTPADKKAKKIKLIRSPICVETNQKSIVTNQTTTDSNSEKFSKDNRTGFLTTKTSKLLNISHHHNTESSGINSVLLTLSNGVKLQTEGASTKPVDAHIKVPDNLVNMHTRVLSKSFNNCTGNKKFDEKTSRILVKSNSPKALQTNVNDGRDSVRLNHDADLKNPMLIDNNNIFETASDMKITTQLSTEPKNSICYSFIETDPQSIHKSIKNTAPTSEKVPDLESNKIINSTETEIEKPSLDLNSSIGNNCSIQNNLICDNSIDVDETNMHNVINKCKKILNDNSKLCTVPMFKDNCIMEKSFKNNTKSLSASGGITTPNDSSITCTTESFLSKCVQKYNDGSRETKESGPQCPDSNHSRFVLNETSPKCDKNASSKFHHNITTAVKDTFMFYSKANSIDANEFISQSPHSSGCNSLLINSDRFNATLSSNLEKSNFHAPESSEIFCNSFHSLLNHSPLVNDECNIGVKVPFFNNASNALLPYSSGAHMSLDNQNIISMQTVQAHPIISETVPKICTEIQHPGDNLQNSVLSNARISPSYNALGVSNNFCSALLESGEVMERKLRTGACEDEDDLDCDRLLGLNVAVGTRNLFSDAISSINVSLSSPSSLSTSTLSSASSRVSAVEEDDDVPHKPIFETDEESCKQRRRSNLKRKRQDDSASGEMCSDNNCYLYSFSFMCNNS